MGKWVDSSETHHYLCLEYGDFPYTLILSKQTAVLIAGHNLTEPGIIVAKNLFQIFGKELSTDIDKLKNDAHLLAIRFLDIAFCVTKELQSK